MLDDEAITGQTFKKFPVPQQAPVREFGKTLSPSKCRPIEIHETGSRNGCRGRYRFMKKGDRKSPVEFQIFRKFVVVDMKIMAELGPCIRTINLFQDVRISRKSGIWNSRES
jgi:hypothetical protein